MKETISFLFCLLLLLSVMLSSVAFAGYSFSQMSEWELLEDVKGINEEVLRRYQGEPIELSVGEYTVGKDIPAGTYSISALFGGANYMLWGSIYNDYSTDGGLLAAVSLNETCSIIKMVLEDGNVVSVTNTVILESFYGNGLELAKDLPIPDPNS